MVIQILSHHVLRFGIFFLANFGALALLGTSYQKAFEMSWWQNCIFFNRCQNIQKACCRRQVLIQLLNTCKLYYIADRVIITFRVEVQTWILQIYSHSRELLLFFTAEFFFYFSCMLPQLVYTPISNFPKCYSAITIPKICQLRRSSWTKSENVYRMKKNIVLIFH